MSHTPSSAHMWWRGPTTALAARPTHPSAWSPLSQPFKKRQALFGFLLCPHGSSLEASTAQCFLARAVSSSLFPVLGWCVLFCFLMEVTPSGIHMEPVIKSGSAARKVHALPSGLCLWPSLQANKPLCALTLTSSVPKTALQTTDLQMKGIE